MADDLTALLDGSWVRRRVDRVEFIDLLTVRRTIALTLDLRRLARVRRSSPVRSEGELVPLGWFVPWANAGAELLDGRGRAIPYLTAAEADHHVGRLLEERLRPFGLGQGRLDRVLRHRLDPGRPSERCPSCMRAEQKDRGRRELMSERWGCPAVLELLDGLKRRSERFPAEAKELARLLLAWQTNFALFAYLDVSDIPGDRMLLQLSYDEELVEWEPPWDRRRRLLSGWRTGLSSADARACRKRISRGGTFAGDLDKLLPGVLARPFARSRFVPLRRYGRRGVYGVVWHVVWDQASGFVVVDQEVDIVLPSELAVVRMRMLRLGRDETRHATVADQVGSRATIVAPQDRGESSAGDGWAQPEQHRSPTLFSLAITQRTPASWHGGGMLALVTGVVLIVLALRSIGEVAAHREAAAAVLLLAPALVSAVLTVRAASEIAEMLTRRLRLLIGSVGVLAVACAVGLVVQPDGPSPLDRLLERLHVGHASTPSFAALRLLWLGVGIVLVGIAAVLFVGGWRIMRLLAHGRRASPRCVEDTEVGRVLNPRRYPRIPPPDRWLKADEGDLVPWGWLDPVVERASPLGDAEIDRSFWRGRHGRRATIVGWVQEAIASPDSACCTASVPARLVHDATRRAGALESRVLDRIEEIAPACSRLIRQAIFEGTRARFDAVLVSEYEPDVIVDIRCVQSPVKVTPSEIGSAAATLLSYTVNARRSALIWLIIVARGQSEEDHVFALGDVLRYDRVLHITVVTEDALESLGFPSRREGSTRWAADLSAWSCK